MTASYKIFIPSEYHAMLDVIEKERLRIVFETMMNTGGRYSEVRWILKHIHETVQIKDKAGHTTDTKKVFDPINHAMYVPGFATKTNKGRDIHLTPAFSKRLYQYLREHKTIKAPGRRTMDENLKRWWYNMQSVVLRDNSIRYILEEKECTHDVRWYPTIKTTRKAWESWLLACRREDGGSKYSYLDIAKSQGHTVDISERYYANLDPRLKSEMDEVRKITEGWGT